MVRKLTHIQVHESFWPNFNRSTAWQPKFPIFVYIVHFSMRLLFLLCMLFSFWRRTTLGFVGKKNQPQIRLWLCHKPCIRNKIVIKKLDIIPACSTRNMNSSASLYTSMCHTRTNFMHQTRVLDIAFPSKRWKRQRLINLLRSFKQYVCDLQNSRTQVHILQEGQRSRHQSFRWKCNRNIRGCSGSRYTGRSAGTPWGRSNYIRKFITHQLTK